MFDEIESGNLKINNLDSFKKDQLNLIMKKIGFDNTEIRSLKENTSKKRAILDLYESIQSGYSQCHHTGNRVKAAGGWYLQLCQHGVTQGSKFMYLSESVRDVIYIHISKKFNAPMNVCDTPCTAAAHLALRDAEDLKNGVLQKKEDGQAYKWLGKTRGCPEKPELGKTPSEVSLPRLELENQKRKKIKLPKIEELESEEHPLTRDTRKYFLGDRFHNTKCPHKSELCRFHDINLCPQLKCATTSGQENLNSIRNRTRLRTTCTQALATHLFYNVVVMDRSHNRKIVKQQAKDLGKHWSRRHPEYMHII